MGRIIGIGLAIIVGVVVLVWALGWIFAPFDVTSVDNVRKQWAFAYQYDESLHAVAKQVCSAERAVKEARGDEERIQRQSQALAFEQNYARIEAEYNAKLRDAFQRAGPALPSHRIQKLETAVVPDHVEPRLTAADNTRDPLNRPEFPHIPMDRVTFREKRRLRVFPVGTHAQHSGPATFYHARPSGNPRVAEHHTSSSRRSSRRKADKYRHIHGVGPIRQH